jgi:hypothetical protein
MINKLITTTVLAVALSTSGCSIGVQLAGHTLNGFVRSQRSLDTVDMVITPDGTYEAMQDIVSGKGILINSEYSRTPGIKGVNVDTRI